MIIINKKVLKIRDEKRKKFIKIMLTEEEYKEIERFSHIEFQTKSEFIRTSVTNRIDQINDTIFPHKEDRIKNGQILKEFRKEAKEKLLVHSNGEFLAKSNEEELKLRRITLNKRKKELETELEQIKRDLRKQ